MATPLWFVKLIKKAFPTRFALARMTRLPLLGRLMQWGLFEGDGMYYLPKETVIKIDAPIPPMTSTVLPSAVIDHFIEAANYHWVMNRCICREAEGCTDYPNDLGCLFLGEAAQGIHPELGHQVDKAEARAHMQRCREAGLVQMIGRNKLDTLWMGVGPGHKLMTICNCCPCCCLWKVLPDLTPRISQHVERMPGVTVTVNDACKGCKLCTRNVCFAGAIHLNEEKRAVIDPARCRGCGRCAEVCPLDAIDVTITDMSFMETAVTHITDLVDVT